MSTSTPSTSRSADAASATPAIEDRPARRVALLAAWAASAAIAASALVFSASPAAGADAAPVRASIHHTAPRLR
jgi:hypothetical protein